MDKEILDKYKKAGEIAANAASFSKKLVKEGALLLDIAEQTEKKIFELGGKPAFPVNVSVNDIAAHHVPSSDEKISLKNGDLVKIDIGVHIDGWIADTAYSISIGKSEENEKLIQAAEAAVESALKIAKKGCEIREIGSAIADAINSSGFQPIRNLTGHLVDQYLLHAGLNIPNYDNGNKTKLEKDSAVAIEPFATTGEGIVVEGKEAEVFSLEKVSAVRSGRDILEFIASEYHTLPFARRWLIKKFGTLKTNLFLREASAKGLIHTYKILREISGAKVSQAEHTVVIAEKPIATTKQ